MRISLVLALATLAACPKSEKAAGATFTRPGVIDTHVHVSPQEVDRLIDVMDEQGIDWVLNLSGMWAGGPLEMQLEAARKSGGRILVACNLPWRAAQRRDFPQIAVKLLERAKALGARALKIEKALGLGAIKYDQTLLATDDPWLDPIWAAAGRLGLPVVIHTGDPKAFWQKPGPGNEREAELKAHPGWSNYDIDGLPSFDALLKQLMSVVARHPKTTFVSVHFGNNAEDPEWVGRQLDRHPNLYVDLAARLPEIGRHDPKALHRLFERHADRIVFGTDLGVSRGGAYMLGSFGETPGTRAEVKPYYDKHWQWLQTWDTNIASPTPIQGTWSISGIGLTPKTLQKIYRGNAIRLFGRPDVSPAKRDPKAKAEP